MFMLSFLFAAAFADVTADLSAITIYAGQYRVVGPSANSCDQNWRDMSLSVDVGTGVISLVYDGNDPHNNPIPNGVAQEYSVSLEPSGGRLSFPFGTQPLRLVLEGESVVRQALGHDGAWKDEAEVMRFSDGSLVYLPTPSGCRFRKVLAQRGE